MKFAIQLFKRDFPNGIDGHQVVADTGNDQGDVATGAGVANGFVQHHDDVIFFASDAPTVAPLQYAIWSKAGIPDFIDLGQDMYNDTARYPYIFGVDPNDYEYAAAAARFLQAKGIKRMAVLSDGALADNELLSDLQSNLNKLNANVTIVKKVTIPPGSVEVSTQVLELKQSNPQVVFVDVGYEYGPIWNAFNASGWDPMILANAGSMYDGYDALGKLGANAYTANFGCVPQGTQFPAYVEADLNGLQALTGNVAGQLASLSNIEAKVMLLKYAVEKYDSVAPTAIKRALETIGNQNVWWPGLLRYNFTPTNHFGMAGPLAASVCSMAPLTQHQIPFIAK